MSEPSGEIRRHPVLDRILHWMMVLAFFFTFASGFALFHPSLFFLANLSGGGPWSALLHPFLGLAMMFFFFWFALRHWRDNLIGKRDIQWLKQIGDVMAHREELVPEQDKYNAGQKMLYYILVLCMIGLLLTGIVVWRRYFSDYFPVGIVRLSLLLHAFVAFVLLSSVFGHIAFAVWVKGSIRSMFRGTVTPGWAYKHHRAWFRKVIGAPPKQDERIVQQGVPAK
jgi:formate dehydrogenase subunit gamma